MPKNTMTDLRNHLFEVMEALKDEDKPMDLPRAKAVVEVAQVLVASAKVEVDFLNAIDSSESTEFLTCNGLRSGAASRGLPARNRCSDGSQGRRMMTRFVIVGTLRRGLLEVPELLDDANQWRALESADEATAREIEILRQRATRFVQAERDPEISAQERDRLTRGGKARERVDRMVWLAERRKAG